MIKTKFVFAVSLVAMLAVGSAWANAPVGDDSVGAAHTVYTDQSPTSTEGVDGSTAIAGVTYVNRAVNKAGASATAAEAHAAAAGASALAAQKSADEAASSAKSANDTLAGKQDKLGFTPEDVANRLVTIPADSNGQAALTDAKYPSAKAVISYVAGELATMDEGFGEQLDAKLDIDQTSANANKAVITDATGKVRTGTITSGMITDKTIVNADISDSAAISASKISGLATVATSGSYNSLSDKPTIGTSSLTIKNGATNTNIATFGANATAAVTATIPAASATVAGLAKIGVIPSGSVESASYASIWVE